MTYVYLLQSESDPTKTYLGVTASLRARLKTHNEGGSTHTSKHRPWKLVSYHAFESKDRAHEFEKFWKSGSGRAFAKRHFW
ncbi:MAG: GIY-YIG nuclease family protein [Akkermansiaceae bacterium]|nr:GIY-YIG nuclease family protein [Akkermansiaceae bacterium]